MRRLLPLGRVQSIFSISILIVFGQNALVLAKPPSALPLQKRKVPHTYPALPLEVLSQTQEAKEKKDRSSSVRSDSGVSREWGLLSIGFFEVFNSIVQPVSASVQSCSSQITVAVIDTGIDYTHPDLKRNLWKNRGETGPWTPPAHLAFSTFCRDKSCNGIDDDGNGFVDDVVGWDFVNDVSLPYDTHGHGTHISGIIGSNPSNESGVSGVCPKASLMALKYYDNSGSGLNNLSNTVRAIHYAIRMGAQIINYSGGGAEPALAEKQAIEEANRKGILFVAAAGNDGHNNDQAPYYPASYGLDNIVGVASINKSNQLLPSSNYGSKVDLAAPGLMILSTLPEGRVGTMSGTSQATAFVTGAAALIASQVPSHFDFKKVKASLLRGAKPFKNADQKKVVASGILSLPQSLAQSSISQNGADKASRPAPSELASTQGGSRTR